MTNATQSPPDAWGEAADRIRGIRLDVIRLRQRHADEADRRELEGIEWALRLFELDARARSEPDPDA